MKKTRISWPWIWQISWQWLIYTAYLACNRLIHVYLYWFWWKIQHSVVESTRFHAKDLCITFISVLDLMNEKNTAFSGRPWNLADFMWNPADFIPRTYTLHLYLYWISWMKKIQHSVIDHEIQWISSWNPVDFMAYLEKCKLENLNIYNTYNFFLCKSNK